MLPECLLMYTLLRLNMLLWVVFDIYAGLCLMAVSLRSGRDVVGNVEVMQLDFEMENFTSLSVTRRINWNIDYKGQNPPPDSEKVVTELTVVQRDIQAIIPLAMVSNDKFIWM